MNLLEAVENCRSELDNERSANTARSYQRGMELFLQCLNEKFGVKSSDDLSVITFRHFVAFPSWLMGHKSDYVKTDNKRLSRQSAFLYLNGAKNFLNWLMINGYLAPSLADKALYEMAVKKAMGQRESKLPEMPKEEDVLKVCAQLREMALAQAPKVKNGDKDARLDLIRAYAMVVLMRTTGLRVSEVCALKVRDIDFDEKKVFVKAGKGKKDRYISFGSNQEFIDAINQYWDARGWRVDGTDYFEDPAFARHDKGARTKKGRTIRKLPITSVTARNDLDHAFKYINPHKFRHFFATALFRFTNNIRIVQEALGHSGIGTTEKYTHIAQVDLDNVMNGFNIDQARKNTESEGTK